MKNNKKERGVALLYVLGILSLLIIMALAFVSTSLFNQRAATNTARRSQANILALSMLDRVVTAVQEFGEDLKYSHSNENARDMFEALDSYYVIGGDKKSYLFNYYTPTVEDGIIKNNIRWIAHLSQDENGPLVVGRSAFMVKPYGRGKINANYLSKASQDEQNQSERRIGVDMDEINVEFFDEAFFSSTIGGVEWIKLFNQTSKGGVLPANDLADFINKVKVKTGEDPSPSDLKTIEKYFVFSGERSKEAYWMDLNGDGERKDDELFHRFCMIAPFGKPSIWEQHIGDPDRVNKVLLMDTNNSGSPNINLLDVATIGGRWRATYPNPNDRYGCGIPWLANFNNRATFDHSRDRKHQIAANLIDYCDMDSIPTSDVNPVDWELTGVDGTDIPRYTGNEKTPYLNEIQAKIILSAEMTQDPPDKDGLVRIRVKGILDATLDAEAINIYKTLGTPKVIETEFRYIIKNPKIQIVIDEPTIETITVIEEETVIIDGEPVVVKTSVEKEIIVIKGVPLNNILSNDPSAPDPTTMILTSKTTTPPSVGYFTGTKIIDGIVAIGQKKYPSTLVPQSASFVVEFDMEIENAKLKFGGKNVDYCKIEKTRNFNKTLKVELDPGEAESKPYIYATQTYDPRQNLNKGDWNSFSEATSTNIGLRNPSSSPRHSGTSRAVETVTDPAYYEDGPTIRHMSTAHIRNAPMISPWELSCIHRGARWETINLKAYNDEKARTVITVGGKEKLPYLPGGGNYADGDANILDQIKMTSDTTSGKKLNLADVTDGVLYGFLGGLHLRSGQNFDDTKSPEDLLESLARSGPKSSVPDSWIGSIKDTRHSSSRAGVANAGRLQEGSTELDRSEIIGKICSLVEIYKDAPMEYFDAIILSQSINDVGDNSPSELAIRKVFKDTNGKLTIAKDFKAKKGEIDSPTDNDSNYIADEVTGQCKLLVRGYRDPTTGKVQLISVKTVE